MTALNSKQGEEEKEEAMQEFIISSVGRELARVQATDAHSALDWFLSTRESYELDEPPSVVAILPQTAFQTAGKSAV